MGASIHKGVCRSITCTKQCHVLLQHCPCQGGGRNLVGPRNSPPTVQWVLSRWSKVTPWMLKLAFFHDSAPITPTTIDVSPPQFQRGTSGRAKNRLKLSGGLSRWRAGMLTSKNARHGTFAYHSI